MTDDTRRLRERLASLMSDWNEREARQTLKMCRRDCDTADAAIHRIEVQMLQQCRMEVETLLSAAHPQVQLEAAAVTPEGPFFKPNADFKQVKDWVAVGDWDRIDATTGLPKAVTPEGRQDDKPIRDMIAWLRGAGHTDAANALAELKAEDDALKTHRARTEGRQAPETPKEHDETRTL